MIYTHMEADKEELSVNSRPDRCASSFMAHTGLRFYRTEDSYSIGRRESDDR